MSGIAVKHADHDVYFRRVKFWWFWYSQYGQIGHNLFARWHRPLCFKRSEVRENGICV